MLDRVLNRPMNMIVSRLTICTKIFLQGKNKTSCPEVFYKKPVLKSFPNFTRKHLPSCPFLTIFKKNKTPLQVVFSVNFANFFYRTPTNSCFWKNDFQIFLYHLTISRKPNFWILLKKIFVA